VEGIGLNLEANKYMGRSLVDVDALVKIGEIYSWLSIGNIETWQILELQLSERLPLIKSNLELLARFSFLVTSCQSHRFSNSIMRSLEKEILAHARSIRKLDFRLYINILSTICLNDIGSEDFQRTLITIENLKHLTRIDTVCHYLASRDIKLLVEGLCSLVSRLKKGVRTYDEYYVENLTLYCATINLILATLCKDLEKLNKINKVDLNDFTHILLVITQSGNKELIFFDSWRDFLIKRVG